MIQNGIAVTKDQKEKLIAELKANKANTFTECELKGKSLDELQKLAALAKVKVDFTTNGGEVKTNKEESRYADPMPEMTFEK